MDIQNSIIAVLRGVRRCQPVHIGRVRFFHFWRHEPGIGRINIAWIKDLRSRQFADRGYEDGFLAQAQRYLAEDKRRFHKCHAFVAPTETFAKEVMRWYGAEKPWFQFANYPTKMRMSETKRRREIVYIDNGSSLYQEELYQSILLFLGEIHRQTKCKGVFIPPRNFHNDVLRLTIPRGVKVLDRRNWDRLSVYGLLVNLDNFKGAAESLPRKLLVYLHSGLYPVVHWSFAESIKFCRQNNIEPICYLDIDDLLPRLQKVDPPPIARNQFCIENRIGGLVEYLREMG